MKKASIFICFSLIILGFRLTAQVSRNEYIVKMYGPANGLSNNTIRSIIQDYKGYLWIGTMDGLNRFDGQSFKVYRNKSGDKTSLSSSNILSLLEDRDSVLWIGTRGAGLNRFNRKKDNFTCYRYDRNDPQSISHNEVFVIYEDREGSIWVGTDGGGLNLFDKKTGKFRSFIKDPNTEGSLAENEVLSISEDEKGNILVGTWAGGISVLNKSTGTFSRISKENTGKNGLLNNNVWVINKDREQFFLGLIGDGIQLYNSFSGEFRKININSGEKGLHDNYSPFAIVKSGENDLWIGTDEGLFTGKRNGRTDVLRNEYNFQRISKELTYSIYQDKFGSIWFGTRDAGLGQVFRKNRKFSIITLQYPEKEKLSMINGVNTISGDAKGYIWLGTDKGVIKLDSRTNKFFYPGSASRWGKNLDGIRSVYTDSKGNIWAGNLSELDKFDPVTGKFRYFFSLPASNGTPGNEEYWKVLEDSPDEFWIGTSKGLYKLNIATGKYKTIIKEGTITDGRNAYHIRTLQKDKHGNLLAGTLGGGLFEIDSVTGNLKHYFNDPDKLNSLINDFVFYIHLSASGEIWLATNHGLELFDQVKNEFVHFQTSQGLPSDVIYGILEDNKHNLWVSSNNGISKFDPVKKKFSNFFFYDQKNYSSFIQRSCYRDRNGRMYFGRAESLITFDPDSTRSDSSTVEVVMTDFKIGNISVKDLSESPLSTNIEDTKSISLKYNQSNFSFEFAAINYIYPENNRYKYWLENFDHDWIYSGNRNLAVYTNIPPGEYIFHVKASNLDGIWNDNGVSIIIHISPPFWKTWFFRIFFTGIILIGFFAWYYQKMRTMRARQTQLVSLVNSRTQDLSQANKGLQDQKEQLARQNTDLLQTRDELSQSNQKLRQALSDITEKEAMLIHSEKMASIGVLTAGIAHEVNNPLNFIQSGVYGLEQIQAGIEKLSKEIEGYPYDFDEVKREKVIALLKELKDEDFQARYKDSMNIILQGVERSTSIIKSMRYYSHPEVTEKSSVNLFELIDSSVVIVKSSLADGIAIETNYQLKEKVDCVPGNISQVILNLLMNAAQAIKDKGKIIVTTYSGPDKNACISVKDNGSGMSSEELKHIFEPFYTTKPVGQGTGLGLFVSYNIIKNHNGTIYCESKPGEGTEFIVSLPL